MEWLQLIPEFTDTLVGAGTLVLGVLAYRQNNEKEDGGESKNDAEVDEHVDDRHKQ